MSTANENQLHTGDDTSVVFPTQLHATIRIVDEKELKDQKLKAYRSGRVFERDGLGIFSSGTAARIRLANGLEERDALDRALHCLAEIPVSFSTAIENVEKKSLLALAGLPFSKGAPGELIVPQLAVVLESGSAPIAIEVNGPGVVIDDFPDDQFGPGPDRFDLASSRSHDDFLARISHALGYINSGRLDKVVIAREVTVEANRPFLQHELVERLRALHPSCAVYALDGFIGASPELLCRKKEDAVYSHPLAGTVARSGDPDEDARLSQAMLDSPKERAEHRFVVEAILDALTPWCDELVAADQPELLELRNVCHLATPISGTLAATRLPSVLVLASLLHPTPAVGGVPQKAALAYIEEFEAINRDRYSGPVGFVRSNGDGEFWIGIRSAMIKTNHARLLAGVGLVAGSQPNAELAETQLKLQALLAAAVRP